MYTFKIQVIKRQQPLVITKVLIHVFRSKAFKLVIDGNIPGCGEHLLDNWYQTLIVTLQCRVFWRTRVTIQLVGSIRSRGGQRKQTSCDVFFLMFTRFNARKGMG
jgi:hypothetical protein